MQPDKDQLITKITYTLEVEETPTGAVRFTMTTNHNMPNKEGDYYIAKHLGAWTHHYKKHWEAFTKTLEGNGILSDITHQNS